MSNKIIFMKFVTTNPSSNLHLLYGYKTVTWNVVWWVARFEVS